MIRVIMAKASPRKRARGRSLTGTLSTRMEMKTMLSIPSTISITVSVNNATQASAEVIQEKSKELTARTGKKSVMRRGD